MKTEELKQIGLTEEQIGAVMKFNGEDIAHAKEVLSAEKQKEIDGLNTQLSTATEALKKFDGVKPEELTSEITKLNEQLATQKADYEKQIADRDFTNLLDRSITAAGGRSTKAVTAMLDIEGLKTSKNQGTDIENAINSLKKDNPWMFGANEPFSNPVANTQGGGNTQPDAMSAIMDKAMGIKRNKEK